VNTALLFAALLHALSAQDALREAAERYARGDAAGAADAYEVAVIDGADNADVFFNLGTSALRAGDIGRAVWALSEARVRAPWDEDVLFNLDLAKRQNPDTVVGHQEPAWHWALALVPRAILQWVAAAAFLLTCLLLGLRGALGSLAWVEQWALRAGAATLALGSLVVVAEWTAGAPTAVVTERETVVRSTERADGPEAFRVHAGLPVRPMAEPRSGLVRIRLANGLEGYAEEAALRWVGGPLRRDPAVTSEAVQPLLR
jgi:hypothetical protein